LNTDHPVMRRRSQRLPISLLTILALTALLLAATLKSLNTVKTVQVEAELQVMTKPAPAPITPGQNQVRNTPDQNQELADALPSIWPTTSHRITSGYGARRDPVEEGTTFHRGVDIAGKTDDPVFSTADGIVAFAGSAGEYGNLIIVSHANGFNTYYGHLNKIFIKAGNDVSKGETIGLIGSTGKSAGPHLHYEISKRGQKIDPVPYLPGSP
jgi:murein DD-endopeptidase MepM/ murein hydrolase activator NlpD